MTSVVCPLPPGKLAAVISVSSWTAIGAFVKAGSFSRHAIRPLLRARATREPSNVVVNTRSLTTVASPSRRSRPTAEFRSVLLHLADELCLEDDDLRGASLRASVSRGLPGNDGCCRLPRSKIARRSHAPLPPGTPIKAPELREQPSMHGHERVDALAGPSVRGYRKSPLRG